MQIALPCLLPCSGTAQRNLGVSTRNFGAFWNCLQVKIRSSYELCTFGGLHGEGRVYSLLTRHVRARVSEEPKQKHEKRILFCWVSLALTFLLNGTTLLSFSEGERFYIPNSWMVNRDDLYEFCLFVARQHNPGLPFFLGGDSYGGCLAIHVGRKFQDSPKDAPSGFRGLCLTAPAIVGDLPAVSKYHRTLLNQ